jgi:hypothetical protein
MESNLGLAQSKTPPHPNGARRPGRPAVPIDLARLRAYRAQGFSVRQIGRMMGVSKSGIATALRRLPNMTGSASENSQALR